MNELVASIAGGVARTVVAAGSGYLVSKGYADADTINATIGGLGTVGVGIWSVWKKIQADKKAKSF